MSIFNKGFNGKYQPCLAFVQKLHTGYHHDATSLVDFPSFFYLSKGQERKAYQYTKLHIDRGSIKNT